MKYDSLTIQDIISKRGYRNNIVGDKFSLFISNYPSNARYLGSRIGNSNLVLAELCCSIGVTLEYMAPHFKKIIGVDVDSEVLKTCATNLVDAGVSNCELIEGDIFSDYILEKIEADIVIYDIPYWYPYTQESGDNLLLKNPPLKELILKIKQHITSNIIIFSPPELSYQFFKQKLGPIEYQMVFINEKHNRNQVYLGSLVQARGKTNIKLRF